MMMLKQTTSGIIKIKDKTKHQQIKKNQNQNSCADKLHDYFELFKWSKKKFQKVQRLIDIKIENW